MSENMRHRIAITLRPPRPAAGNGRNSSRTRRGRPFALLARPIHLGGPTPRQTGPRQEQLAAWAPSGPAYSARTVWAPSGRTRSAQAVRTGTFGGAGKFGKNSLGPVRADTFGSGRSYRHVRCEQRLGPANSGRTAWAPSGPAYLARTAWGPSWPAYSTRTVWAPSRPAYSTRTVWAPSGRARLAQAVRTSTFGESSGWGRQVRQGQLGAVRAGRFGKNNLGLVRAGTFGKNKLGPLGADRTRSARAVWAGTLGRAARVCLSHGPRRVQLKSLSLRAMVIELGTSGAGARPRHPLPNLTALDGRAPFDRHSPGRAQLGPHSPFHWPGPSITNTRCVDPLRPAVECSVAIRSKPFPRVHRCDALTKESSGAGRRELFEWSCAGV